MIFAICFLVCNIFSVLVFIIKAVSFQFTGFSLMTTISFLSLILFMTDEFDINPSH